MATRVIMPKLGMAMTEGMVVKWLKDDGAPVTAGEPIVVVMSKKITYEVQAPGDGILRHVAQPKETYPIGQVIGFVTAPGEALPPPELGPAPVVEAAGAAGPPAPVEARAGAAAEPGEAFPSSPAARRLARELGVEIARVRPSGRRITEEDVRRFHQEEAQIQASPLARRMAEEEGLDLRQVQGSGPGQRITEEDVLRALDARGVPPTSPPAAQPGARLSFLGMRQAIAEQMVHSLQTMAQVSMSTTADVTELKGTREALGARWGRKPSYTDLLIKAVTVALREHPLLGAKLEGDEIVLPTELHIGVAVALDDGLIVPVLRYADRLTLREIGDRLADLAGRARQNALAVDEVSGGTLTITNLGIYGIDTFTPIVNPPEVAILGVGRVFQELALVAGQVVVRDKMTLSLTVDHRIVDGAPGAHFLQTLVQLLEHPALIFVAEG
jgi:pyruvate dehydrogenase E2 component (dihydrolipoamide acetyltransferase)